MRVKYFEKNNFFILLSCFLFVNIYLCTSCDYKTTNLQSEKEITHTVAVLPKDMTTSLAVNSEKQIVKEAQSNASLDTTSIRETLVALEDTVTNKEETEKIASEEVEVLDEIINTSQSNGEEIESTFEPTNSTNDLVANEAEISNENEILAKDTGQLNSNSEIENTLKMKVNDVGTTSTITQTSNKDVATEESTTIEQTEIVESNTTKPAIPPTNQTIGNIANSLTNQSSISPTTTPIATQQEAAKPSGTFYDKLAEEQATKSNPNNNPAARPSNLQTISQIPTDDQGIEQQLKEAQIAIENAKKAVEAAEKERQALEAERQKQNMPKVGDGGE